MSPTTSVSGLASGLDTAAIITAIMDVERRPIALLQSRQFTKTNQLTAWKSIEALILGVQTQAAIIQKSSTFESAISALSSDDTILTATAESNAAFGTYNLTVNQLAQNHQIASVGYDDSDTTSFGSGTIQISVGDSTESVAIESGQDTLEGVRDAINAAGINVTASIIDTGETSYNKQLILTSSETGADNTISVTSSLTGGQESLSFTAPGSSVASAWSANSTATIGTPGAYYGTRANSYTFTVGTLADSVIGSPDLDDWTGATPTMGGTYTGSKDKTYEFYVAQGGTLGTDTIELTLSDGENVETVTIGPTYDGSPISVGTEGVTLTLPTTGSIVAGETFTVDLETGQGLVGSDSQDVLVDWTDLYGNSGQFNLNASYTAGDPIDLGDGLQVSFDAASVEEGDQFTLAVTPGSGVNTIQDAQDAIVQFGSGGTPIEVRSATNQLTTLIEGVTVDLHSADEETTISLEIERDDTGIEGDIQSFVDRYNDLIQLINDQFKYDQELDQAGVLMADSSLIALQSQVRSMVTGVQPEMSGDIRTLAQVGIRSGNDGKLSFDTSIFQSKLDDDFDGVVALFSELGSSTDGDIRFVSSTTDTVSEATGYRIEVTQAATHGEQSGEDIEVSVANPVTIDVAHLKMRLTIDGKDSGIFNLEEGTYNSGEDLAEMVERSLYEETSFGAQDVEVVWEEDSLNPDEGALVIRSLTWGADSTVQIGSPPSSANDRLGLGSTGVSSGQNVQGRINGQLAIGTGRLLTSQNGASKGLAVEVLLTDEELGTQGTDQGHVSFTRGMGFRLNELIEGYTSATGLVGGRISSLQSQIDVLADQIESMEDRLVDREASLVAQFVAMETAISAFQTQGAFLNSQLAGLQNLNTAIAKR